MKKWVVLLCFMLVASLIVPNGLVNANTNFKDIGSTYRAQAEIVYLADRGIVSGYSDGTFLPDKQVTRAEAAAMLGRALNLDGEKRSTSFSDVSAGNMASGYIVELVKKGVISGYSNGTFRPDNVLNRGEMAVLINRAFNLGSGNAATILMDKGIAQGFADGSFGESATIIRADFSVFLARSLNENFRVVTFNTPMYVNTGSTTLNFRTGPSTSYAVISKLTNGTAVSVAKSENGWSHIKVNNVTGYVSTGFLSAVKPGSVLPATPPTGASDLTVIIDPGHGAHDPGGIGHGFQEKNVVLNIARHMQSYFDKSPITGKMTRNSDTFVELGDRARFASKNDGDIFVSIHTNALNGEAKGQETFYYAQTAATNPHVKQSRALAIYLQARMQEAWNLTNRGVNPFGYGNFYVLRENTVPSALVEMGFIDSPIDIQYIREEAQRVKMGKALFLGTLDYFYHYEGRKDVLPSYSNVGATPSKPLH